QTGFGLRETGYYRNYSGSTQIVNFNVLVECRLIKHFSLIGNTGWLQHARSSPFYIRGFRQLNQTEQASELKIRNTAYIGFGARANIRIWQGDLYAGLTHNLGSAKLKRRLRTATRSDDLFYNYRRDYIWLTTYCIGYTYWPVPRLGVSLQLSETTSRAASKSDPVYIPNFQIDNIGEGSFYDDTVTATTFQEPLQASIHIGLHYRF
ncbi:MAG: hypothetical protein WBA17_15470, partial [Saprospiraceae bacterium]